MLRFFHQLFNGARQVSSTHERDGAEGTRAIATLGYFHIGIVAGMGKQTLSDQLMLVVCFELFQNSRQFPRTKKCINLRYLLFKVILVALREAARYVNLVHQTFFFGIDIL